MDFDDNIKVSVLKTKENKTVCGFNICSVLFVLYNDTLGTASCGWNSTPGDTNKNVSKFNSYFGTIWVLAQN